MVEIKIKQGQEYNGMEIKIRQGRDSTNLKWTIKLINVGNKQLKSRFLNNIICNRAWLAVYFLHLKFLV